MKRQRSKAELLAHIRTYSAIKKDAENETSITGRMAYWRMSVEWCATLWKEENFSTNEIVKFIQYIKANYTDELTKERREEIRTAIGNKGTDWNLRNGASQQCKKNAVDKAVTELIYYNTQVSVDYCLIACEYLMKHKGYAKKRLDRVMGDIYFLDDLQPTMIWDLRQDLFDNKGIWVELSNDDIPENAQII